MPAWARTLLPAEATWPQFPTGLASLGVSRKPQLRTTTAVGREWEETYGLLRRDDPLMAAFLAMVNDFWRNMTVFDIDHRALRALLGVGGGTPAISAGSQTGSSIAVTGFPASTAAVLRAGDVIRFPGRTLVYDVTADVASDGAGAAVVPINPPIYPGGSPTVGNLVTNATPGSVLFRARLIEFEPPAAGPNAAYSGLTVRFQEVPG